MKNLSLVLLGLASLGLALPIHESRSSQSTLSNGLAQQRVGFTVKKIEYQPQDQGTEPRTFTGNTERQKQVQEQELPFIRSNSKEFNLSDETIAQQSLLRTSVPSSSQYGVFLGKSVSFTYHPLRISSATYRKSVDLLDFIDKHGPECVGISIFVLVPVAYLMLELLELVVKFFVPERFPERGRGRLKLSGPERQIRAMSDIEREKMVEKQRFWWQRTRSRS